MRFLGRHLRRARLIIIVGALIAAVTIYFNSPVFATVIVTSNIATATRFNQRQIIKNPRGAKAWYAFVQKGDGGGAGGTDCDDSGEGLRVLSSTDGSTWVDRGQLVTSADTVIDANCKVLADVVGYDDGSQFRMYVAYAGGITNTRDQMKLYYEYLTVADGDSAVTGIGSPNVADSLQENDFVSIGLDSNGHVWILHYDSGFGPDNWKIIGTRQHYPTTDTPTWDASAELGNTAASTGVKEPASAELLTFSSAATNRGAAIFTDRPNANGNQFLSARNITSFSASPDDVNTVHTFGLGTRTSIKDGGSTTSADWTFAAVVDSTDTVHLVYKTTPSTGTIKTHSRKATSAGDAEALSGATETEVDANTPDTVTLSVDWGCATDKLYAFYHYGTSTVRYRTSNVDTISWSGESTIAESNDINYMTASRREEDADISLIYTKATSTFDVIWQKLDGCVSNSAPNAPTLSSPASGATITGTTQVFQLSATDPDSDSIKYEIKIFNTTTQSGGNCSGSTFENQDQNVSQGGWSQAGAYASGATASYTNQTAFTRGNSYCWQARGKDPTGSNSFGSWSTPSTFTVNSTPAAPTLINPSSAQTNISVLPQFQLRTTDADSDYLKYHIKVYSAQAECDSDSGTNLVRSIDQTASQTGWQGQDVQAGTAYTGSSTLTSSPVAIHNYQASALSSNTAYWWKGRAIDPGGSNTSGSWATCISFTTATSEVQIQGGTEIRGGTVIQ